MSKLNKQDTIDEYTEFFGITPLSSMTATEMRRIIDIGKEIDDKSDEEYLKFLAMLPPKQLRFTYSDIPKDVKTKPAMLDYIKRKHFSADTLNLTELKENLPKLTVEQLNHMTITQLQQRYKIPSKYVRKPEIIKYILEESPEENKQSLVEGRVNTIQNEIFEELRNKFVKISDSTGFKYFGQIVGFSKAMLKVRMIPYNSERIGNNFNFDTKNKIIVDWVEKHPPGKNDSITNYYLYRNEKGQYYLKLTDYRGYLMEDINEEVIRYSHD